MFFCLLATAEIFFGVVAGQSHDGDDLDFAILYVENLLLGDVHPLVKSNVLAKRTQLVQRRVGM